MDQRLWSIAMNLLIQVNTAHCLFWLRFWPRGARWDKSKFYKCLLPNCKCQITKILSKNKAFNMHAYFSGSPCQKIYKVCSKFLFWQQVYLDVFEHEFMFAVKFDIQKPLLHYQIARPCSFNGIISFIFLGSFLSKKCHFKSNQSQMSGTLKMYSRNLSLVSCFSLYFIAIP